MNSVWSIFNEPPEDLWGLRGDVYMWNLLRSACYNYEKMTIEEFDELASTVYGKATGHALYEPVVDDDGGQDYVLLFAAVGYGMSRGYISRKWWVDKGLPILRERLRLHNARNGYVNSKEDAGVGVQDDIEAKRAAAEAKVAAMSLKEMMEKSIPVLKKKLANEPNNKKWQKMLKQAEAYLAKSEHIAVCEALGINPNKMTKD